MQPMAPSPLLSDSGHEGLPPQMKEWRLVAVGGEHVNRIADGFVPSDVEFRFRHPDIEVRSRKPYAVLLVALPYNSPDAPTRLVLPVTPTLETHLNRLHRASACGNTVAPRLANRIEVFNIYHVIRRAHAFTNAEPILGSPHKLTHPELNHWHSTANCRADSTCPPQDWATKEPTVSLLAARLSLTALASPGHAFGTVRTLHWPQWRTPPPTPVVDWSSTNITAPRTAPFVSRCEAGPGCICSDPRHMHATLLLRL